MNEEIKTAYKTRQILNEGLDTLDRKIADNLLRGRQNALNHQRRHAMWLRMAGTGHNVELAFLSNARSLLAVMALSMGAVGTYYLNAYDQAKEYEEIDSALLSGELPPTAYLDRGFHAWLERASESSSQ